MSLLDLQRKAYEHKMMSNYEKAKATVALGPIATAQALEDLKDKIKEMQMLYESRIKMLEEKVEHLQAELSKK